MTCLRNFAYYILEKEDDVLTFVLDSSVPQSVQDELADIALDNADVPVHVDFVLGDCSSAAASQHLALEVASNGSLYESIYMLEDDFLHTVGSRHILEEGIGIFDYVTLYDHPDKYMIGGPNKRVNGGIRGHGAEHTQVFLTKSSHWKITDSTVMTFACKRSTLLTDMDLIRASIGEKFPDSYNMFETLRNERNRIVGSCIPGKSTHVETMWLTPLTDWKWVASNHVNK